MIIPKFKNNAPLLVSVLMVQPNIIKAKVPSPDWTRGLSVITCASTLCDVSQRSLLNHYLLAVYDVEALLNLVDTLASNGVDCVLSHVVSLHAINSIGVINLLKFTA